MDSRYFQILPSLCLIMASFLWGSSFVAMKLAFQGYHPVVVVLGRMLVASLVFLFFLPRFRQIRIRRHDWPLLLIMAISEPCLYFFFEALARQNTSASQASMITAILPLLIAFASVYFLGERMTPQAIVGLLLATAGVLLLSLSGIISEQAPAPLLGNFYELLAMLCATVYTLAVKRLTCFYPPLFLTALQAWVGVLFFAPFLALPQVPLPQAMLIVPVAAIVYLGLAVTFFAYGLYKGLGKNKSSRLAGLFSHLLRHEKSFIALLCASFRSSNMTENPAQYGTIYSCRGPNFALMHMPVSKTGGFITLIPLFTLMLSRIIFQESLTPLQVLGGLIILLGVLLNQDFSILTSKRK